MDKQNNKREYCQLGMLYFSLFITGVLCLANGDNISGKVICLIRVILSKTLYGSQDLPRGSEATHLNQYIGVSAARFDLR